MTIKRKRFGKEYVSAFNDIFPTVLRKSTTDMFLVSIKITPDTKQNKNISDAKENIWKVTTNIIDAISYKLQNGYKEYGLNNITDPISSLLFLDIFSHVVNKFIPEHSYRKTIKYITNRIEEHYPILYESLDNYRRFVIDSSNVSDDLKDVLDMSYFLSNIMCDIITTDTKDNIEISYHDGMLELFTSSIRYATNNLITT